MVRLAIVFGLVLAACGGNVVFVEDGSAGGGGAGSGGRPNPPDGPGPGPGGFGSGGAPTTNSVMVTNDSTSTGMPSFFCDDIGVCQSDTGDPKEGCFECAVLGDSSVAVDGGVCYESYTQCFGTNFDCSNGNQDCCDLIGCFDMCANE